MAQFVDSRHAAMAFMSDAGFQNRSRPHTPPKTPRGKLPLDGRESSPASSIHPTETVSPAKKGANATTEDFLDTIKVQELTEVEFEYMEGTEIVYPGGFEEFEEVVVRDDMDVSDLSESDMEGSDSAMAQKLSQLYCEDPAGEAEMRRVRRQRRLSKRFGSRTFKRSHSKSVKSESEASDSDAMGDHDLTRSARRLRRKVSVLEQDAAEVRKNVSAYRSPNSAISPTLDDRPIPFSSSKLASRRHVTPYVEEENETGGDGNHPARSPELMDLSD